ncbi:MAG TPA: hypothetical protein VK131_14495 [Candidatus Acidoferrales bacterium]|nr:hypothetical protein [Candidatus Acidoferrales bacterium]
MLRRLLQRWPALERLAVRVLGHFTTWPADEFARFVRAPIPAGAGGAGAARPPAVAPRRPPEPLASAPGAFELRFNRLQGEGRYEEMWRLVAEDAQRAWGSEARFVEGMARQAAGAELLDAQVAGVALLSEWTDQRHQRSYRNVARLQVRYRLRHQHREWTMERQLHLVPAADGWRTLCYPPGR